MTNYIPSKELIAAIKKFEGLRLRAYRDCGKGVFTIGYGHTSGVKPGQVITTQYADKLLDADLLEVAKFLNMQGICKTQGEFDALADWCFNLGTYRLLHSIGDGKPTTLYNKIKAGAPTKDIQEQFLRWNKSGGKELKGLTERRKWEAQRYAE